MIYGMVESQCCIVASTSLRKSLAPRLPLRGNIGTHPLVQKNCRFNEMRGMMVRGMRCARTGAVL